MKYEDGSITKWRFITFKTHWTVSRSQNNSAPSDNAAKHKETPCMNRKILEKDGSS